MQGGAARGVSGIYPRPAGKQRGHDIPISFERGVVQQSGSVRCSCVGIGAFFEKQRDHVGLPAHYGVQQLPENRRVASGQLRLFQQQAHHGSVAVAKSFVQRGGSAVIAGSHIRAVLYQQSRYFTVALHGGFVQRRYSGIRIVNIRVRPVFQQNRHNLQLAFPRRLVQRSGTGRIPGIHIGALRDEYPYHLTVSPIGGKVKRSRSEF